MFQGVQRRMRQVSKTKDFCNRRHITEKAKGSTAVPPTNPAQKTIITKSPRQRNVSSNNTLETRNDIPKAFAIGTLAGTMGSLAGMGGGFVMIPLLTGICRLSQHQAHGTSLAAVMATGIAGAISYQDKVDYEAALPIAMTAMFTASLGARTTTFLSEKWLKRALGGLLLIMGPAVPAKRYIVEQQLKKETADAQERTAQALLYPKWVAPAGIGLCSGYLAGLFGVGGGTLVVPALIFTSQQTHDNPYTHHQALATSLAAMVLPALAGTLTHAKAGNVAFRVAPPLALGALFGAYGGGKLALGTNETTLQWGFSALLVLLGARTVQKTL